MFSLFHILFLNLSSVSDLCVESISSLSSIKLMMLLELNQMWDVNVSTDCCSENVEIIFLALHSTICDIGYKAFMWQVRNVISHIIELVR